MVRNSRILIAELCMTSWMAIIFMLVVLATMYLIEVPAMSHQLAAAQYINQDKFHEAAMELAAWTRAGDWKDNPGFYQTAAIIHAHNGHTDAAEWNKKKAKELRAK